MSNQPIIVKRVEEDDHDDHHGGGWKVAYADFMTAMMAFFLMLWILNSADADKLKGIAEYFTPVLVSETGGGPGFLSGDRLDSDGRLVGSGSSGDPAPAVPTFGQESPLKVFDSRLRYEDIPEVVVEYEAPGTQGGQAAQPPADADAADVGGAEGRAEIAQDSAEEGVEAQELAAAREATLEAVRADIESVISANAQFEGLSRNLRVDRTPEGLEVQIVDDAGQSMFHSGSARIEARTRAVIEAIGASIADLPQAVAITGHTDAVPFSRPAAYDNWELSSDRANATRRVLIAAGLDPSRIVRVSGMADKAPLVADPTAAENRRISVMLLYPEE
ncbi:flagellar motor protein MotB [Roseivivax sp. CAU 1761]